VTELPVGWIRGILGEVCDINPSLDDVLDDDDECSFVPMAAVAEESGKADTSARRQFGELRRKSFRSFRSNDLIVAKITPSMENGKAAVVDQLVNGLGFGSTEFHVLRARGGMDPRYLLHYALQRSFREEAAHHMTGTAGQRRVPARYLKEARLPIPPAAEQPRIVAAIEEHLSRLDAAKAALASGIALLGILTERVLDSPANASPVTLGEIALEMRYGTSTRCAYDAAGPPVLRIPNVRDRRIDLSDLKRAVNTEAAVPRVDPEDLLFIRTNGSRDLVGRVAVVDPDAAGLGFASYLIQVRLDPSRADAAFVAIVLSTQKLRREIEGRAASTAGQYNLSQPKLAALEIPLPGIDEQRRLRTEAEARLDSLERLRRSLVAAGHRADVLRRAILARAFRGELVAQDLSDEPASVLLERIAAERAEAPKPTRKRTTKAPA
jgi:type I restriction enzyme, S subunit